MFDWLVKPLEYMINSITAPLRLMVFIGTTFYGVLGACMRFLYKCVLWVPMEMAVAVGALIVVSVLYKILGRENQS